MGRMVPPELMRIWELQRERARTEMAEQRTRALIEKARERVRRGLEVLRVT